MKTDIERRMYRLDTVRLTLTCTPQELTVLRNNLSTLIDHSTYSVSAITRELFAVIVAAQQRAIAPKGVTDATQIRVIAEGHQSKHQNGKGRRRAAEAGGGHRALESRQVNQEEVRGA